MRYCSEGKNEMPFVGAELSDARSGFVAAHRSWLLWATFARA